MTLKRYWFEFEIADRPDSPLLARLRMGCGITADSYNDALHLLCERVLKDIHLPPTHKYIEDVDISTLDANHVLPNMEVPVLRGIWFPPGYN